MWDVIYFKRGIDFLQAAIVDVKEVDGHLKIAYENRAFYFKGTINLSLAAGEATSVGVFEVTLDNESNSYELLITGQVKRKPGLVYFEGTCSQVTEPTKPWNLVVQYRPLHELTNAPTAMYPSHEGSQSFI